MNIVQARLSIVGLRPLLWHKFGPESLPLEKLEKTGVAGNDPDEWKRTVTVTEGGQLYYDPSYMFACLREGGRYIIRSRQSLLKLVSATLQITDNRILIDRWIPGWNDGLPDEMPTDPNLDCYLDVRGVRNPSTKARNIRYRVACSLGWETSCNLLFDKTIVSREEMHSVAIHAGQLVGIGDGRSIGFGRFEVKAFDCE